MMHRLFTILIVLVALIACERGKRELAEAKKPINALSDIAVSPFTHTGPKSIVVAASAINGEATFKKNCSACHQLNGAGLPGAFPPLVGSEWVITPSREILATIMLYGLQGEIEVKGVKWNNVMAGLGAQMSDDELAATANYIRSAWGNSADEELDAQLFADIRAKWGSRAMLSVSEITAEYGNP